MPKWPFPPPQSCGVSTAIKFVQTCLNQVRIAEYVGSPEILLMTFSGVTARTSSCDTFVVAIISPVRCFTPLVRFGGILVVQCLSSMVPVVNLLDKLS